MAHIILKKLLAKKETLSVVKDVVSALDISIEIQDLQGRTILGSSQINQSNQYAIEASGQLIGWVFGSEKASSVASLINHLVNKEIEQKTLANELLDKYREITLLYDISQKITASLDLQEVAKLVIDEAQRLIQATSGSIMLFNQRRMRLELLSSFGNKSEQKLNLSLGEGIAGNVVLTGTGEIVNDALADPRFVPSQAQVNSLICVPLKSKDRVIGAIRMSNSAPVTYTAEDLKLLTLLASQAASAIENAIFHDKKLQENRRDALLFRLANQIRLSLDLDTILETAVSEIRNLLQLDRCQFIWYRPGDLELEGTEPYPESTSSRVNKKSYWEVVTEARNPDLPSLIGEYTAEEMGCFTQQLLDREMIRVNDVRTLTDSVVHRFLVCPCFTSVLAIPIQTRSGAIGTIAVSTNTELRCWSDREVELLQAVANQLAIALDQAELYNESAIAAQRAQAQTQQLQQTLAELQQTQAQLIQSEKMSSLGQLVAGVAHEINNPVNFIHGNLDYLYQYTEDVLDLLQLYAKHYPEPVPDIQAKIEAIDLEFLMADLPKMLSSMRLGSDRIRQIVVSLRNFSRHDQAEMKPVDIHEGIDSTLLILQHRLKGRKDHPTPIQVFKEYSQLPLVECYPSQLNQVFMNILSNAIDAVEESAVNSHQSVVSSKITDNRQLITDTPKIWIHTDVDDNNNVIIRIRDNGPGIAETVKNRLFDPFFTTKPIGKGTGLGLSISYQIVVQKHGGVLKCNSTPGQGTEFWIEIPIVPVAALNKI